MNIRWDRFGARLGVGLAVAGFVLIFLGWNGAASVDRVPSQFPYLISGGVAGLGLVVVGAVLMLVQSGREDRARLRAEIVELREALEQTTMPSAPSGSEGSAPAPDTSDLVVCGPEVFHDPSCRLLEGRGELPLLSPEAAAEEGLRPCRVCSPPTETPPQRAGAKRKPRRPARRS